MRTRPFRILLALGAVLLLAGACSKKDDTASTTGTTAKAGDTGTTAKGTGTTAKGSGGSTVPAADLAALVKGATLKSPGTLTICSDIPYAPFEFPDDKDGGKLTGFDVQLADSMATELGLKTDWQTTPFDGIIAALKAGNCDVIVSATTIKPERAEQVAFTKPYFDADQSLLVLAKNKDTYKTLDSLAGKVIGVQAGTTGADYAAENKPEGATIKEYPGADDLFAAMTADDIQAVLQDLPVNAYRAKLQPSNFAVTETFKTGEQYGMATTKENPKLTQALDGALANARASGEYETIYTEWFGTPAG